MMKNTIKQNFFYELESILKSLDQTAELTLKKYQKKGRKAKYKNKRDEQLDMLLSPKEIAEKQKAKKEMENYTKIAISSIILSSGGLFYKPLSILSIPGIIYTSLLVHAKALQALKEHKITTDTLTSITIIGCMINGNLLIASIAELLYVISRRIMINVTEGTKKNLVNIFRQQSKYAWLKTEYGEIKMSIDSLKIGDIIVVHAGETVPIDGKIVSGLGSFDEHVLTGESRPVEKSIGENVFAMTVVISGRNLCISVEKSIDDTVAAKICGILNSTVEFKSSTQLRAEELANKTVVPTLVLSAAAYPLINFSGSLAVLNSHFKNKMSIVAPISIMNFLNQASEDGILVKDGRTLDILNKIDTVVFDKTGTLTEDQLIVTRIYSYNGYKENEVLQYAAAAEYKNTHPIAKAIIAEADRMQLQLQQIEESEYQAGHGLSVNLNGDSISIGNVRFFDYLGIEIPSFLDDLRQQNYQKGNTSVMVARNNKVIGMIELSIKIRKEAKQIVEQLKKRANIKNLYIISGDHEIPTKKLAEELGISNYFAGVLPQEKAEIIENLKKQGRFICYVGDGINDSLALKQSHVSISIKGASTIATDVAQVILMNGDLSKIDTIFEISQDFHKNINKTFYIIVSPMVVGITGAFFLKFTLAHTIVLNLLSLAGGVCNSMIPYSKTNKQNLPNKIDNQKLDEDSKKPKLLEKNQNEDNLLNKDEQELLDEVEQTEKQLRT